jgi:hypothetical protein
MTHRNVRNTVLGSFCNRRDARVRVLKCLRHKGFRTPSPVGGLARKFADVPLPACAFRFASGAGEALQSVFSPLRRASLVWCPANNWGLSGV